MSKSMTNRDRNTSSAKLAIQKNSHSERCCAFCFTPVILGSKLFRSFLLFLFCILIGGAVYVAQDIEVYFTKMYFVSDRSKIREWFAANEKYFQPGGAQTVTYVYDNTVKGVDFSELEV